MRSNKLLQTFATALLLAASAAASIVPDWATVLKAQSYYGAVDLRLSAQPSGAVRAGATTDVLVALANAGPDDAHGAHARAVLRGDVQPAATSGCNEDPAGFPLCTLSTPLVAGGTSDFLLRLQVPPSARGEIALALSAASLDDETNPGQELVLLQLPIEAHVDLRSSILCQRPYLTGGGSLSCQVTLQNLGSSAALTPRFTFAVNGASLFDFSCSSTRADLCPPALPAQWTSAVLGSNDTAVLWFQLTADPGVETVTVDVTALGTGEIEDYPSDNADTMFIPVPLFRDGFEVVPLAAH